MVVDELLPLLIAHGGMSEHFTLQYTGEVGTNLVHQFHDFHASFEGTCSDKNLNMMYQIAKNVLFASVSSPTPQRCIILPPGFRGNIDKFLATRILVEITLLLADSDN